MLYYKAICEKHDYFTGETVAKDELCTTKERNTRYRYISDRYFYPVDVPKSQTFTIFGRRFLKHNED